MNKKTCVFVLGTVRVRIGVQSGSFPWELIHTTVVAELAIEQSTHRRSQALLLVVHAVGLAQVADLDDGHGLKIIGVPRRPGQYRRFAACAGMVSGSAACDIGGTFFYEQSAAVVSPCR